MRIFEERNGLPQVDLANGRPVPPDFLAKLRGEVAHNLLKGGVKPPDQPPPAAAPPGPAENRGTSASRTGGDSPRQAGAGASSA